ncbi:FAD-binding oxidoreductase [Chitiniphilus purpureus]|uniref:FAD-binding oxidoreductase n=1 Tax=Chitiniphilus purpureus TaxID=2981137 RepID=A0ABY6DNV9_9NEIS|nr:FAD-binding oxidoreductase [Chitiniphilus sp. CD1]UXY16027.1 FAD-binding oxidoreductase [Chitiniphilus sp. CD1]
MNDFLSDLSALLGAGGVLTGQASAGYLLDQRRRWQGVALAVARPRHTDEVAALVKLCAAHGVSIVPQGGNTSLCGGATPDASGRQLLVSFERMNRIVAVDAANDTITAEAGATIAQVQQAARAANRLFPAEWAASASSQVGGALATNAGGVNVLHYGNMRELTLGLEVVLADGRVWNGLRGLRKDNTGYDLKHLFIGAEGTLGLITQAVFRLYPQPAAHATALVNVAGPAAAVALLRGLQAAIGDRVTSFELISRRCWELLARYCPELPQPHATPPAWCVLVEISDAGADAALLERLAQALVDLGFEDALVAHSPGDAQAFWALRESIPEAQRRRGVSIKHDIAVPISAIPAFLEQAEQAVKSGFPGADIVAFGHVGDGNLHYNVFLDDQTNSVYCHEPAINRLVYGVVAQLEGTLSAEHGIGVLKRDELAHYRSPLELELMRLIKTALDPAGRLNPDKVIRLEPPAGGTAAPD